MILSDLAEQYRWQEMPKKVKIRSVAHDQDIPAYLKFLQRISWPSDKIFDDFKISL